MQRFLKSDCVRKCTADINILITSRNLDRKIMHSIRMTTGPPTRIRKWNQVSQFKQYQINTYRKDLNWLHFDNEPRFQDQQQVKNQQSYVSNFVAYLKYPSSSQNNQLRCNNSTICKSVGQLYRDKKQSQKKETSKNKLRLRFFEGSFNNRHNVRASI